MIKTILYCGNDWTQDHKTSAHHIAEELAHDYKVLYIECGGLRSPQLNLWDIKKIILKAKKAFQGIRKKDSNLFLYSLLQLPFHQHLWIRNINEKFVKFILKKLIKKEESNAFALWLTLPHLHYLIGNLCEEIAIYYCVDEYSALQNVERNTVMFMDEKTSQKADIIFVTAESLLKAKKHLKVPVVYSPHGVDFSHFNKTFNIKQIPESIKNINKPIIGFFGTIDRSVDIELIRFLAIMKPTWSFLMIGRIATNITPIDKIHNVYFTGSCPYEKLPDYASTFDVSIIPYRLIDRVPHANPLKLREYLAIGKPIVSTPVQEVVKYSDVIQIAEDKEGFLNKIEHVLDHDTVELQEKRLSLVRGESWEVITKRALNHVLDIYKKIKK